MSMLRLNPTLQAIVLGLVFASVGFSFSLATSAQPAAGRSVSARAIQTGCTRPPVEFVTLPDLDLAVAGSQFTRQIVVRFGFKPHQFRFVSAPTGLKISESGLITGKVEAGANPFVVEVLDVVNGLPTTPIFRTFNVTGVAQTESPAALHIINNEALPVAVANEAYSFTLHANGGTPPYRFDFASNADYAALPLGLALSPEGLIFGKPLTPTTNGDATFTIAVVDGNLSRVTKTFTLQVLPGTISNEFITTSGSFNLNFGRVNEDRVKLSIKMNKTALLLAGINERTELEGISFALQFGGAKLPSEGAAAFNKAGVIRFPVPTVGVLPAANSPRYNISFSPRTGNLKADFRNIALVRELGAQFASFQNPIIPIQVSLSIPTGQTDDEGNAEEETTDKIEVAQFDYRRGGATAVGTTRANALHAPGGFFMVTKVTGTEQRVTNAQDAIFLKIRGVLRQAGGTAVAPQAADQVSVLLGNVCLGTFPASDMLAVGGKLTITNLDPAIGLRNLTIDNNKGTFSIETNGLNPFAIFSQDFLVAGDVYYLPVTLTVGSAFDGQSSIALTRKGNQIANR